ncbi:dGTPase [Burkholderia cenocepacia]|nr:dGTPase [Burkholderia cenocepacia]RQU86864.1 dGTPase [Burkholderia cenocepacia]RQV87779.1 dGTPase [Burkholderia cenocepacia]
MTNPYKNLLSSSRLRKSEVADRSVLTDSESDRGRVLFCPAFRRLQQKAQVFSMEPNAAVRSRLTHSLEVSQLGRYIADEICKRFDKTDLTLDADRRGAFVNFVETACLLHDIGNPPFGHFGEEAIQTWFNEHGAELIREATGIDKNTAKDEVNRALADFLQFDGNPQGLRVVSRLQWNTDPYGLNLTKTTLAAFLKYIRSTGEEMEGPFAKKAGFFSTEEDVVKTIRDEFGYTRAQRFPLAYVMEAADDIAYCVSDLEDSIEKGLIHEASTLEEIQQKFLARKFDKSCPTLEPLKDALSSIRDGKDVRGREYTYTNFRTSVNRRIVEYVAERYTKNHDSILQGNFERLLPKDEPPGALLAELKEFCRKHVYDHVSIHRTELAGYTALRGILDHCALLLKMNSQDFRAALHKQPDDANKSQILIQIKLLSLFPKRYIKVYKHSTENLSGPNSALTEWNARAHLVTDFVAGMTDDFAMTTYRTLAGMRL